MQTGSEQNRKSSLLEKWLNREKKTETLYEGIKPYPQNAKIPLSLGQKRLLFLQQLYPENPFYHYADAYKFKGKLDVEKLLKSFELIAQRHDILRTTFVFEDGQTFQKIHKQAQFEVSEHDLRDIPLENLKETSKKLAVEEARKPFDLQKGALTRISILRLGDEEYLLALTMHHIITDKWSMRVFRDELAEFYLKLCNGEQIEVRPLDIQYADYAFWQASQKPSSNDVSYWKNNLANSLEFLHLPYDFPRPNRPTFTGAYLSQEFSAELSKGLKELCRKTGTTLFTLLLAVYKILLKNYTGETDILVGSPFTNRDKIELENLIGFFNDTLVLRSDLSNDVTFIELLQQVWQTNQAALAHKNMPFETLVKSLQPDRYLNYNPLFQVMFIHHGVPETPSFGQDLKIEHEPFDFGVTKFDLTLYISEEEEQISAIFEYSKDLFVEKTIKRMHAHLRNLLEEIVKNPHQRISDLPTTTSKEIELFDEWNNRNSQEPNAKSINELFLEQVNSFPNNEAIVFQNKTLTYAELNRRANSVANYLIKQSLDRNIPVGLFVEPSINMIVGIFGILKAGLPYLPIDAEYPSERISFILKDSGAKIVLTQKNLLDRVSDLSTQPQSIEELIDTEDSNEPILQTEIDKDDLAYVIYTSGSTGQPKGVAVTHKNLVHSTAARFDFYQKNPKSFLLLSSFSFDSSVVGIFWTLATGGKLVLAERRIEQDLSRLASVFETEKITHTLLLPTLYSTLIRNIPNEQFRSFDAIIVAGESCPTSLCEEHFKVFPNLKLYNEYGPTEATVWATAHEVKPEDTKTNIPIGKPIPHAKIYILDENQNRIPIGVTGEMYIGGKGIAKGYFNDSELTEKQFVRNPFNDTEKLYRTGDLCRYRYDGAIEFLGRKDDQVKIRGYRVELGEIEKVIKQDSNIRNVTVKVEGRNESDESGDETLALAERLREMDVIEADEVLKSVEKLSDTEIEVMLGETARA